MQVLTHGRQAGPVLVPAVSPALGRHRLQQVKGPAHGAGDGDAVRRACGVTGAGALDRAIHVAHRLRRGACIGEVHPQQLQAFVDGVVWLSLEELGQQADLDPLLALLTLPVRPEAQLKISTPQILERRPDLLSTVLTILFERFPTCTLEDIMVIAGIPTDQLLHTRAAQDLLDRGRQEGEARGREEGEARGRQEGEARGRAAEAASVTLRQLNRLCGPLSEATTARIRALPLEQLELLAEALLDFSGPADLAAWLKEHAG